MKATVNGITIEGTVQEIYEFIKLYDGKQIIQNPSNPYSPFSNPNYIGDPPLTYSQLTCKSDGTLVNTKSIEERLNE